MANKNKYLGMTSLRNKNPEKFFPPVRMNAFPTTLLKEKVALVTGGATGIGLGIARSFAYVGAKVVIASRKQATDRVAQSLMESTGGMVHAIKLNVRTASDRARIYDQIEKHYGAPCNLLVNCAAGSFAAPSERITVAGYNHIFSSIVEGAYDLTTKLYQRNKGTTPTTVLNITAAFASDGTPFMVPSAMAKSAITAMTKSMANEYAKGGMRINCLAPGPAYESAGMSKIATGMGNDIGESSNRIVTPIGRNIYPHEIGNLAAYLCSDYASHVNGTTLTMDGGQHLVGYAQNFFHDVPVSLWEGVQKMKEDQKIWRKTKYHLN